MKLLNLLYEFDYGKKLFADPSHYSNIQTTSDLDIVGYRKYADIETDTDDEVRALELLDMFYSGDFVNLDETALYKLIVSLKKLKSKFPKILDPRTSPGIGQTVYRGATISIDLVKDMPLMIDGSNIILKVPNNFKVRPQSGRPIHSFSIKRYMAVNYALNQTFLSVENPNRVPVIICVDVNDPNLLFSTRFSELHSVYREEEEVFYANYDITVNELILKSAIIEDIYKEHANSSNQLVRSVYTKWYNAIN